MLWPKEASGVGGAVVSPFPTFQGPQCSWLSSQLGWEIPVLVFSLGVTSGSCRSSPVCLISAHMWKEKIHMFMCFQKGLAVAAVDGDFFLQLLADGWRCWS